MTRIPARFRFVAWLLLLVGVSPSAGRAETNWPQWRGPLGSGQSAETSLPVKWTDEQIVWRCELKGDGHSSPVIWNDQIFLTSATDVGGSRRVICVERTSGKQLWEKEAWSGAPNVSHAMNNWASATCATDGERVVAFFGKGGLHCFDMRGTPLWSRQLGQFAGPWGTAASPIIVGDLAIQNCDADDAAYLLAVDKRTGETVWKTDRYQVRGWSTPIVVNTGRRTELVLNGHQGIRAYDPSSGKELWFCRNSTGRGAPTVAPTADGGLLIAVNGRPGDLLACRPGGSGQVNQTHEVWRTARRGGRDLPSPLVIGDHLLVVSLRPGTATCYAAASGKELDRIRLEGNFSASPIAAGGLAYVPNEAGEIYVLRLGERLETVARNKLPAEENEVFRASLTPCQGQLFCRSNRALYCIGR